MREYLLDSERDARIVLSNTALTGSKPKQQVCPRGHTPHLAAGV